MCTLTLLQRVLYLMMVKRQEWALNLMEWVYTLVLPQAREVEFEDGQITIDMSPTTFQRRLSEKALSLLVLYKAWSHNETFGLLLLDSALSTLRSGQYLLKVLS